MIPPRNLVTISKLTALSRTRRKHFQQLSYPRSPARAKNQSPKPEVGLVTLHGPIDFYETPMTSGDTVISTVAAQDDIDFTGPVTEFYLWAVPATFARVLLREPTKPNQLGLVDSVLLDQLVDAQLMASETMIRAARRKFTVSSILAGCWTRHNAGILAAEDARNWIGQLPEHGDLPRAIGHEGAFAFRPMMRRRHAA